uniref:Uncharacterized protein n=1 Tax=Knipowitschia caucasica TaxID=637954 RepID=A0AAV2MD81_KNICA
MIMVCMFSKAFTGRMQGADVRLRGELPSESGAEPLQTQGPGVGQKTCRKPLSAWVSRRGSARPANPRGPCLPQPQPWPAASAMCRWLSGFSNTCEHNTYGGIGGGCSPAPGQRQWLNLFQAQVWSKRGARP